MAESKEERNKRISQATIEEARKYEEEQRAFAEEHRLPFEDGRETDEEAAERVSIVRRSMMFGDMPTDPTTGDPQVPVADQEGATVSQAEADAVAEIKDDEKADSMSMLEQARQDAHGLSDESLAEASDEEPAADEGGMPTGESEGQEKGSAKEKVAAIREAQSVEEVDELVGDDDRVTVTRAADERKAELS